MDCDMCGKSGQLFKVMIEGTQMTVCEPCSRYGKVLFRVRTDSEIKKIEKDRKARPVVVRKETIFLIVDNYSSLVKRGRERMGLKQEDVAKRLAEKESVLHNIESGKFEPGIELARKLERFFGITLVEEHEEEHKVGARSSSSSMTLGDLIKVKKN